MSVPRMPRPRLPQFRLPTIRIPVHIPQVGCPGADSRGFVGEQFGNLPDLVDATHVKHLRKVVNDQIFSLLKGKLPTILRKFFYGKKALELIAYITDIIAVLNTVIATAVAEYNATIAFINGKKNEINVLIAELEAVPAGARTATQRLALERFDEYLSELDGQLARLETSIACIAE